MARLRGGSDADATRHGGCLEEAPRPVGRWIASADTPDGPSLGLGDLALDAIAEALAPFEGITLARVGRCARFWHTTTSSLRPTDAAGRLRAPSPSASANACRVRGP